MSLTPEDFRKAGWGLCPQVPGIAPYRGWHCGLLDPAHGRGLCDEHVALHEDGRSHLLNTSRFAFHMTPERWRWLVENGFPRSEDFNPPSISPISDAMIDAEIRRAQNARAAA